MVMQPEGFPIDLKLRRYHVLPFFTHVLRLREAPVFRKEILTMSDTSLATVKMPKANMANALVD